jgi:molybdopterin converting factor small subunit
MKKYPRESWEEYILTDKTLIRNREKFYMDNKKTQKRITEEILKSKETPAIVKEQIRLLTSGRITIDNQEVIKLLWELYYENGENKTALRSWIDQDDAGRLYNNIVDMKREVRKLIKLDGEETIEVDWGSAHPNILAHFILIYWNMKENETENFLNRITQVAYENEYEPFDIFIDEVRRMPVDIINIDDDELDEEIRKVLTFIHDLTAGKMKQKLYNHLKEKYPKIKRQESKDMMNAAINRHLFTGMKNIESVKYNDIENKYGNIFLPLEIMKVITEQQKKKTSWNIISKIFRNIESRLMQQSLIKLKENGITAIWIHDGVRVKITDADKTKELMEETLNNNFFLKQTANIKS